MNKHKKTPMSIRQAVEYTAKQGRLFLSKENVNNYIFGAGSSNNAAEGVLCM